MLILENTQPRRTILVRNQINQEALTIFHAVTLKFDSNYSDKKNAHRRHIFKQSDIIYLDEIDLLKAKR